MDYKCKLLDGQRLEIEFVGQDKGKIVYQLSKRTIAAIEELKKNKEYSEAIKKVYLNQAIGHIASCLVSVHNITSGIKSLIPLEGDMSILSIFSGAVKEISRQNTEAIEEGLGKKISAAARTVLTSEHK